MAKDLKNIKDMEELKSFLTESIGPSKRKPKLSLQPTFPDTWVGKLKRKVHELLQGENAYNMGEERATAQKKVQSIETARTKAIGRASGLTETELNRLKGKK